MADCSRCEDRGLRECPECHGSGGGFFSTCPRCRGAGKVLCSCPAARYTREWQEREDRAARKSPRPIGNPGGGFFG